MANLNTRQKRSSALNFALPYRTLPVPDDNGVDTKAQRSMMLFFYSALVPPTVAFADAIIRTLGVWSPTISHVGVWLQSATTIGKWESLVNNAGVWSPSISHSGRWSPTVNTTGRS